MQVVKPTKKELGKFRATKDEGRGNEWEKKRGGGGNNIVGGGKKKKELSRGSGKKEFEKKVKINTQCNKEGAQGREGLRGKAFKRERKKEEKRRRKTEGRGKSHHVHPGGKYRRDPSFTEEQEESK